MHRENSNRGRTIGGLLLLAAFIFATAGVAKADQLILSRSVFQGSNNSCFRNNNGTTGIQVTLGLGQCPRSATLPAISGTAHSSGPGAPTTGTYSFTLLNSNMPMMTLVRVGTSSTFTVLGTQPQFSFIYQNGSTVHLTGTLRFTQIIQTSNPDHALIAFAEFIRTGGTSPQFFGAGGTLFAQYVLGASSQTLIDIWNNVVPQNPLNPDAGWVGIGGEFVVEGDITPFLAPTAANVSVRGRVVTASGLGVAKASVTLTAPDGQMRTVLTNPLGFYSFDDVEVGFTYVVSVAAKRYSFANPSITTGVVDELFGLDFVADGL
jgi:hypothetical protein